MTLQYLTDQDGKPTAVVIPIKDWEAITQKDADLKQREVLTKERMKPSEYAGMLSKKEASEFQNYLTKVREE
jgi:hypothetical protein